MLFPRNALASGPQACFSAEKGIAKVKVGTDQKISCLAIHPFAILGPSSYKRPRQILKICSP
jgi:hypothetical protein